MGSCRKGQHREWAVRLAVRYPRACHQPTQAGSFRRPVTAVSTQLKQRDGVVLARHCRFAVSAPVAPSRQGRLRQAEARRWPRGICTGSSRMT